ncbi:ribosome biogenesis factor YjgA [Marinobacterium jannaschii]|uniref:ribosome biogenesis factor YjgA n=1 Tax=Marinobacterium jannaschii TaxID=64970 RepID=UPI00047F6D8B|nr:ribosome biogenesis factor YjgA [Marinobacterium jannaschii]
MIQDEDFNSINKSSEEEEWVSRTQIKRQMEALQKLGEKLIALKPDQLAKVPMSEALAAAIEEAGRIKPRSSAMKRHMNYVGRLMRTEDAEAIQQGLDLFDASKQAHNAVFHKLERWRDRLISGGNDELQQYLSENPQAEIQHLRQLVRNAKKEAEKGQAPAHARKLFKYLRELAEEQLNR